MIGAIFPAHYNDRGFVAGGAQTPLLGALGRLMLYGGI